MSVPPAEALGALVLVQSSIELPGGSSIWKRRERWRPVESRHRTSQPPFA
jgi:hypothetical protein